jgi:hypothetical protein
LVTTAPCQHIHPPSHRERNGIRGSHEGSPSPTTQGIQDIPGTDKYFFIEFKNIPEDIQITYGKLVCDYKPHKQGKERVRLTVGGNRLDYSGDVATSTAEFTTFKILISSTLSTEDAAMMMMDINNYYLGNPLPRFEYMKVLLSRSPEEIINKYNLNALAVDGWVYIEIRKGMYGLKQARLLANQLLQTCLEPFGYYPARYTQGILSHKPRPISFTLVVDDFTVKYFGKHHAEHLRNALLGTYKLTTDLTATVYSGIPLKWDYNKRTCNISMPGYVLNVLSKSQHDSAKHPQHTPSRYVSPVYSAKTQYANIDETPPLTAQQCLTIQKVTGSILYYARAIDPKGDGENASLQESNARLLSNPPGRHNPISRLQHDIAHPQRCLLPLGLQRTEPSRRSFSLRKHVIQARNT